MGAEVAVCGASIGEVSQTVRLDPDVPGAYQRQGAGWQTRINAVLRAHMPKEPE